LAPPEAAIHAGFNSTTRRNRRELDLLECAFDSQLSIEHLVFDYQQQIAWQKGHEPHTPDPQIDSGESEVDQPLSWHLTKRQQRWITGNLDRNTTVSDRQKMKEALDWFNHPQATTCKETVAPQ
jgi:hypothetical protein